jgi:Na+-driven multidrug efflux pump
MASKSMIGLASGAILNILGDYIFVRVLKLEVFGAGMSTGISQAISFSILLFMNIYYSKARVSVLFISKRITYYYDIVTAGFPSLIRQGFASISSGLLNNFTNPFGDDAIAAMSVVNKYIMFVTCVALGIGQGFQPVASFNHSCKKYLRVKQALLFEMFFSLAVMLLFTSTGLIIPGRIIGIFNKSLEVKKIAEPALRAASIGALFTPISTAANMLYQSIRKSGIASFLALLRSGIVFIPTLFILKMMDIGFKGVYLTQPIADFITALISIPFVLYYLFKYPSVNEEDLM